MGTTTRIYGALIALSVAAPVAGRAQTAQDAPHVRACSPSASTLIAEAYRKSPTVRRLVDALDGTDVVVYVEDRVLSHLHGQLKFASQVAGYRYVKVSIEIRLTKSRRIAMLAHELQHAFEVASAPSVIDQGSFDGLYQQIGYRVAYGYETDAARNATRDAASELTADAEPKGAVIVR